MKKKTPDYCNADYCKHLNKPEFKNNICEGCYYNYKEPKIIREVLYDDKEQGDTERI